MLIFLGLNQSLGEKWVETIIFRWEFLGIFRPTVVFKGHLPSPSPKNSGGFEFCVTFMGNFWARFPLATDRSLHFPRTSFKRGVKQN